MPVDIELAAEPFDQEGTITRVDFFSGNSLIGSVSNSPYSLTWSNAPPGVHSLSASASDDRSTNFFEECGKDHGFEYSTGHFHYLTVERRDLHRACGPDNCGGGDGC